MRIGGIKRVKRDASLAAVVLLLTLTLPLAASAADRVGVIDLGTVIDESQAGREANAVLNRFIEERQQWLVPYEERLDDLLARLNGEDEALSAGERAALQAEFDELAQEYFAMVEQFEAEIQAAAQTLREQLLSDIEVVVRMVGEARGFDLVLEASDVYFYRRVVDLTFEVIREYDHLWEQSRQQAEQ